MAKRKPAKKAAPFLGAAFSIKSKAAKKGWITKKKIAALQEAEKRSKASKKGWVTRKAKAREKEQEKAKKRPVKRQKVRGQRVYKPRRPYNHDVTNDAKEIILERKALFYVQWAGQFQQIKADKSLLDFEHFIDEILTDFFEEARELEINSPHVVWYISNWQSHDYTLVLDKTHLTGLEEGDFDLGDYFFNYF